MYAFARATGRHVTINNEYAHGRHEQRTGSARAANVPVCDSRPYIGLYEQVHKHANQGPSALCFSIYLRN